MTRDITAPIGSVKARKSQGRATTIHPLDVPQVSAARSANIPEGSYLRYGAAGKIGIDMKLVAIAAATNSADSATLFVVQPLIDFSVE